MDLLRLSPVPATTHGASRTITDLALILTIAAVSIAANALLFAIPITTTLLGTVATGCTALAIVASLAGALSAQTNNPILGPVLVIPGAAPILQAALAQSLTILAGLTLVYAGLAWFLWPHALGEAS